MKLEYKIWDKINKEFCNHSVKQKGSLMFDTSCFFMGDEKDYIILLFTGLEDLRNKKIYEGDIINIHIEDENPPFYEVKLGKYHNYVRLPDDTYIMALIPQHYGFYLKNIKTNDETPFLMVNKNSEVIGNIYENPELIKGEMKK